MSSRVLNERPRAAGRPRAKELVSKLRNFAEQAVTGGRISPKERREILALYREGFNGYTYFES